MALKMDLFIVPNLTLKWPLRTLLIYLIYIRLILDLYFNLPKLTWDLFVMPYQTI